MFLLTYSSAEKLFFTALQLDAQIKRYLSCHYIKLLYKHTKGFYRLLSFLLTTEFSHSEQDAVKVSSTFAVFTVSSKNH